MNLSKIINRFIYRDLVYIFSGSFILFYSGYIYNFDKCYLQYFKIINLIIKDNSTNFIFIFLLAGLSYISALFSQILFKSFFPSGIFANQKIYQDNLVNLLKKYNDEKDIILENLERFVFFKQIGTTLGSSLMISFFHKVLCYLW